MNRTNVAKTTMTKTQRTVAQVERTFLTRMRPLWIVGASLVAAAVALAVFRSVLPLSTNKVEAGQRMTTAAEASAFGATIPNTATCSRAVATRHGVDSRR